MTLPDIQLYSNAEEVESYWEVVPGFKKFRLYWSPTGAVGSFVLLRDNVPNFGTFGKKTTMVKFTRTSIGLEGSASFYLALTGVDDANVESSLGTARLVAGLADQLVEAGTVNSPITISENLSRIIPETTPTDIKFTHDVKFLEIFNNSATAVLYVEVTGFKASVERSMPVLPKVYYTVFRNLSKDMGVSMIAAGGSVDTRIVVHY